MANKREPEEEESKYSWMDTYGDLVTLLLCFFVLLYSFSSIDAKKWNELVKAFTGSTSVSAIEALDANTGRPLTDIQIINPKENDEKLNTSKQEDKKEDKKEDYKYQYQTSEEQKIIDQDFDKLYQNIKLYIQNNNLTELSVSKTKNVILLRFNEIALFDSGKATILPQNKGTIAQIVKIIHENISSIELVRIEGHTDNVPINTSEFPSNLELSVRRATNTYHLVNTGEIGSSMLFAGGYGDTRPIASNDTAEGRSQNRRVDFVLEKKQTE